MHPAFEVLFHVMADDDNPSPESEYEGHIDRFVAERERRGTTPELRLIADLLRRTWRDNRRLARKVAKIKTLSGLIPICASCKQIRDDQGYWQQVEHYVAARSQAEFSHGICPRCVESHYSQEYPSTGRRTRLCRGTGA